MKSAVGLITYRTALKLCLENRIGYGTSQPTTRSVRCMEGISLHGMTRMNSLNYVSVNSQVSIASADTLPLRVEVST